MREGGNYGAGTSLAGALVYGPCCHTKGGSIRVGLKFVYLDAAWLNEGRCPGGRPSVSEN